MPRFGHRTEGRRPLGRFRRSGIGSAGEAVHAGRHYRGAMLRSRLTLLPRPFEIALAAVLATSAVISTMLDPTATHPAAELVAVLVGGCVVLRTAAPLIMAIVAAAGVVTMAFLPAPSTPLWAFATLLVIAFSVAAHVAGARAFVALGLLLAASYVIQVRTSSTTVEMLLTPLILVSAPALAGWLLARSRAQTLRLRELAHQLERSQAQVAALSAEAERARITRELHDVLGHTLSSIAVQAGAAGELLGDHAAASLVQQIRRTSREGLDEVRAVLDAQSDKHAADGARGISALAIADGAAMSVTGHERAIPPDVAAASYRIAQEALTNARRHAAGRPVRIVLDFGVHELGIDVVNDGPVPPAHGTGRGLAGIHERALALGGRANVGPDEANAGWRVRVRLPLAPAGEQATGVAP